MGAHPTAGSGLARRGHGWTHALLRDHDR